MLKVSRAPRNTICHNVGIKPDDVIVAFDGEPAVDMLDVAYYDSQEKFSVTVKRENKQLTFNVEKDQNATMGWDFYDFSYVEPRRCHNNCVFCFVDQMPQGMRDTLYVKDDDWRLSFVSGNYVTLTNLSDSDFKRILRRKYSPLYVSVHATDEKVRSTLLGVKPGVPVCDVLSQFAAVGITVHAQVVLTPGYNDGAVLDKTFADLFELYPGVCDVAVVPVGLTKFRNGLPQITPVDAALAKETVCQVECFAKKAFQMTGSNFAYCSDEMYLRANLPLPPYSYYGDFAQLENGVGLVADFDYQFNLAYNDAKKAKSGSYTVVTGVSAAPILESAISRAKADFSQLSAEVLAVPNDFFGHSVTVAGLLCGCDVIAAVKKFAHGDTLLLPRVMLKENADVFLDGVTLKQLINETGKKVEITSDGYETCQAILECD